MIFKVIYENVYKRSITIERVNKSVKMELIKQNDPFSDIPTTYQPVDIKTVKLIGEIPSRSKEGINVKRKRKSNIEMIMNNNTNKRLCIEIEESAINTEDNDDKILGKIIMKSYTSDKLYTIEICENKSHKDKNRFYCLCDCGVQYTDMKRTRCKHIGYIIGSIFDNMTNNKTSDIRFMNRTINRTINNIIQRFNLISFEIVNEEEHIEEICKFKYRNEFNEDIIVKLLLKSDNKIILQREGSSDNNCNNIQLIACSLIKSYIKSFKLKSERNTYVKQYNKDIKNIVSYDF